MRKTSPLRNIEVDVLDISVAKNKSLEPFMKTLVAPPENVMQESLGTLLGLFGVSDRKDTSAYVVNYLASVAKKEYFLNPRRGAIESFESMLHHTNLALADLVKNGQASWVGSLHGVIAIVEKGNIHFSLTGEARIFLFRGERLIDIGEDLASPEAATHPLKTFVEISSGRLSDGDRVVIASPEVFEVFSFSELDRNARRLIPEGKFSRFLETALRNELTIGGALVLDAKEVAIPAAASHEKRAKREKPIDLPNAWSATSFEERQRAEAETVFIPGEPDTAKQAPVDPRVGDIYVQGDAPDGNESHPAVVSFEWMLEDAKKAIRRGAAAARKSVVRGLSEASSSVVSGIGNGFTVMKRSAKRSTVATLERIRKEAQEQKKKLAARTVTPDTPIDPKQSPSHTAVPSRPIPGAARIAVTYSATVEKTKTLFKNIPKQVLQIPTSTPTHAESVSIPAGPVPETKQKPKFVMPEVRIPSLPRSIPFPKLPSGGKAVEALRALPWRKAYLVIGRAVSMSGRALRTGFTALSETTVVLRRKFFAQTPKQQLLSAAGVAFLLTMTAIAIRHAEKPAPVAIPVITPVETKVAFTVPAGEKNASLASPSTSFPVSGTVTSVSLKGKLFIVTGTGLTDTETGTAYAAPSSPIITGSAMDDLSAVFLVSGDRHVSTFYPATGKFATNVITLPSGDAPRTIGTFLTYLYVFDQGQQQVVRYPRADGGFGAGKNWLAGAPTIQDITGFAVSENLYLYSQADAAAYSKGKPVAGFSLEKPATTLTVTDLCANPDAPDTFAVLDAPAKRILIYSGQGQIVKQLFDEELAQATSCSLSTDGATTAVSSDSASFVYANQ